MRTTQKLGYFNNGLQSSNVIVTVFYIVVRPGLQTDILISAILELYVSNKQSVTDPGIQYISELVELVEDVILLGNVSPC